MPGQVYMQKLNDPGQEHPIILEDVENIGMATPFLILNFTNGTTVLERADEYKSVQFTPYETNDSGEQATGEVSDN